MAGCEEEQADAGPLPGKAVVSERRHARPMDDVQLGRACRMARVRLRLRQADVGAGARVSQSLVSRIERGDLDRIPLATVRRVAGRLGISVDLRARWRGGELDRMLAAAHSLLQDEVAAALRAAGWDVVPEVTFSIYGERGSVDILARHPPTGVLLVVEIKTQLVDVGELLSTFDRKRRLTPAVATARGWPIGPVSAWVVMAEGRTNRRHVATHRHIVRAALPADGRTMHPWLRQPGHPVAALSFWTPMRQVTGRRDAAPIRRVSVRRSCHRRAAS